MHAAPAGPTTWQVMLPIWALEDRPEVYRNEEFMNSLTTQTAIALFQCFEAQQKRGGKAEETFQKDPPLPTRHYDAGPDNRADLIHPAR